MATKAFCDEHQRGDVWGPWTQKVTNKGSYNEAGQHNAIDALIQQLYSHAALTGRGNLRVSWNSLEPFWETSWWDAHLPADLANQELDLQVASFIQAVLWCGSEEVAWWDKKNKRGCTVLLYSSRAAPTPQCSWH
jgi:hypothetical protein